MVLIFLQERTIYRSRMCQKHHINDMGSSNKSSNGKTPELTAMTVLYKTIHHG